jgi:hypothetical protein
MTELDEDFAASSAYQLDSEKGGGPKVVAIQTGDRPPGLSSWVTIKPIG